MVEATQNPFDNKGIITAAIALSAIGAILYNVLPLFIGVSQDFRGLNDARSGLLGSAFYVGFTGATISAFFWIRSCSWRVATLLALVTAIAALALTGATPTFGFTLLCTAISGGAFSILYGIGTTILAETGDPARWYGAKIAAEAGLGATLMLLIPGAVEAWGFAGMLIAIVAATLLLAPLLWKTPAGSARSAATGDESGLQQKSPGHAIWFGLGCVLLFMTAATMVWAFLERLANEGGYDLVIAGRILSFTLVMAVAGSLLSAWAGDRFGLQRPLTAACLIFVSAASVLAWSSSLPAFAAGACLLTFGIGMGLPVAVSIAAFLDPDGRHVVLTVPAIGFGVMIAPASGGLLAESIGYSSVLYASGCLALVALATATYALRLHAKHAAPAGTATPEETQSPPLI
ncbi:MAG: MFS transporter [Gammaproteobacteria bacterium]